MVSLSFSVNYRVLTFKMQSVILRSLFSSYVTLRVFAMVLMLYKNPVCERDKNPCVVDTGFF